MEMKLRLTPVLISVAVTSLVLFGGWFLYNSLAMKEPVIEIAKDFPGVKDAKVDIQGDLVSVDLMLGAEANIGAIVDSLRRDAQRVVGNKSLDIKIEDNSNEELDAWWSSVLFDVAEAMENRRYGEIPDLLDNAKREGMKIDTSIDDAYVYVRITEGEHTKFVLLERVPPVLGAWGA